MPRLYDDFATRWRNFFCLAVNVSTAVRTGIVYPYSYVILLTIFIFV